MPSIWFSFPLLATALCCLAGCPAPPNTAVDGRPPTTEKAPTTEKGAPRNAVPPLPDVLPAELSKHDLQWVRAFTEALCATPSSLDNPPESLMCAPAIVEPQMLSYVGRAHPKETPEGRGISSTNLNYHDYHRHIWRYGPHLTVWVAGDDAMDQLNVFHAIRAWLLFEQTAPDLFARVVVATREFAQEPLQGGMKFRNRNARTVISFDETPDYIAASKVLFEFPCPPVGNEFRCSNTSIISVHKRRITGAQTDFGSRPLYGRKPDVLNYYLYLRDGMVESLAHESLHTFIDARYTTNTDLASLRTLRDESDEACGKHDLEEVLTAATSLNHFRVIRRISPSYLDYYDNLMRRKLAQLRDCPKFGAWERAFSPNVADGAVHPIQLVPIRN